MVFAWERFHLALMSLVGEGTLKKRLGDAFVHCLLEIKPENDLPREVWQAFAALQSALTVKSTIPDERNVRASIATMSEDQALDCARQIVTLYDQIARQL